MNQVINHQLTEKNEIVSLPCSASLLLIDDDLNFIRGLRTLLNFYRHHNERQITIVEEVYREENILSAIATNLPDLVLLDMELTPGKLSGLAVLEQLKTLDYPSKVLVLSAYHDDEVIFQAMEAGARGYILKDCLVEQLLPAIATVLKEQIYFPPEVATRFFRSFEINAQRNFRSARKKQLNFLEQQVKLTEREAEVLQLLIEGASNRQISKQLYITVATVKAHLTSIFEKLNVTSRTQAIVKAFKLGLI